MSKAFTSETDDDEESFQPPPLPPGVRNYMTPQGHAQMKAEYERLTQERASLSGNDLLIQRRQRRLDQRLAFLVDRLNAAEVVDHSGTPSDRVRFGSTVTVRDVRGDAQTWTIVGIDEMDIDRGKMSWQSPLSTQLLDKKVGERVTVGKQQFVIETLK